MQISTLRPGLLVGYKTSIRGNVSYQKRDIEADHIDDDGARRAAWETRRTVAAPREFEEATTIRSKARSLVTAVCASSNFGLLCPEADAGKLADAVAEARVFVDAFNATAVMTHIDVYLIAARIASDDAEAVRAINSEVRDLITAMERGIVKLDADAVRAAATKARSLGKILSPFASAQVQRAIETARAAARQISKAGEGVSVEIDRQVVETLRNARTAFLDLDETDETAPAPAAPMATGRAVDFDDEPMVMRAAPAQAAMSLLFD